MIIRCTVSDLLSSNMYMLIEGDGAIIVDPCRKTDMPAGVTPERILLTHEHYDHISGVNAWKKEYGTKTLCSKACNERMQSPKKNMARYFEAFSTLQVGLDNGTPTDYEPFYVCRADEVFEEDTELVWRGHTIRLIALPGHSPGSAGFLIDRFLFSGDSVFLEQDTVLNFPGGSEKDWKEIALPKLRALPPDTMVFPGHFTSFPLKDWKQYKE